MANQPLRKAVEEAYFERLKASFERLTEKEKTQAKVIFRQINSLHDKFADIINVLGAIHSSAASLRHLDKPRRRRLMEKGLRENMDMLEECEVDAGTKITNVRREINILIDYARKLHTLENWMIAFERRCEIDVFRK